MPRDCASVHTLYCLSSTFCFYIFRHHIFLFDHVLKSIASRSYSLRTSIMFNLFYIMLIRCLIKLRCGRVVALLSLLFYLEIFRTCSFNLRSSDNPKKVHLPLERSKGTAAPVSGRNVQSGWLGVSASLSLLAGFALVKFTRCPSLACQHFQHLPARNDIHLLCCSPLVLPPVPGYIVDIAFSLTQFTNKG